MKWKLGLYRCYIYIHIYIKEIYELQSMFPGLRSAVRKSKIPLNIEASLNPASGLSDPDPQNASHLKWRLARMTVSLVERSLK